MDSKAFDAPRYFKNMLQTKKFEELRSTDIDLKSEIKSLDGNMKTLVHNNYKKFIIAADTINKMNKNIEGMEAEMLNLQRNIEKIEASSNVVTHHISPKCGQIETTTPIPS
uniref:Vacuolar protein sorting-associated protein 51 homolog n=1 Tax=Arcella intermedia TaxID=1963864 RepID=A0A6B2LRZ4_9EUKA